MYAKATLSPSTNAWSRSSAAAVPPMQRAAASHAMGKTRIAFMFAPSPGFIRLKLRPKLTPHSRQKAIRDPAATTPWRLCPGLGADEGFFLRRRHRTAPRFAPQIEYRQRAAERCER